MATKKPTVASLQKEVDKLSALVETLEQANKQLTKELVEQKHTLELMNITMVGFGFSAKLSPKRIARATADQLQKYTDNNLHPIIRRTDELAKELMEREIAQSQEAIKEVENNAE